MPESLVPTSEEAALARQLVGRLDARNVTLSLGDEAGQERLPPAVLSLLMRILRHLAAGEAVAVMPMDQELTTQEAADLLGVSRPFIIGRLDAGEIPCRKVGTHRRVLVRDLVEYRRRMALASEKALDELAAEAQRLDLGY